MFLRASFLIVAVMGIESFASDQCTFSKDTVEFREPHYSNDRLSIRNTTDSVVSIDTIRFTWEIDGVRQSEPIGMEFFRGSEDMWYMVPQVIERPDTSFCYYTGIYNQEMVIEPHGLIDLSNFLFGHCIGCVGVLRGQWSDGEVSIRTAFINNRSGRDTVVFVGKVSAMISSGTRSSI